MLSPLELYQIFYRKYSYPGWWPIYSRRGNPGFDVRGYRLNKPSYPLEAGECIEIVIGAILTQNTNWNNVEKALDRLHKAGYLNPGAITTCEQNKLAELIVSSGYYNQKAKKLQNTFIKLQDCVNPGREELLGVWGIGPETADSILLYAFGKAWFVIDAYTRRLCSRLGLVDADCSYDALQSYMVRDLDADIYLYQDFHAYIVLHAKEYCRSKPFCSLCPLTAYCRYNQNRSMI